MYKNNDIPESVMVAVNWIVEKIQTTTVVDLGVAWRDKPTRLTKDQEQEIKELLAEKLSTRIKNSPSAIVSMNENGFVDLFMAFGVNPFVTFKPKTMLLISRKRVLVSEMRDHWTELK